MLLVIQNRTRTKVIVNELLGAIASGATKNFDVTIAELEFSRAKLIALEDAGIISFTTEDSDPIDDRAEGATISSVRTLAITQLQDDVLAGPAVTTGPISSSVVALRGQETMTQDRAAAALPALTGKLVPVPGNTYAARGALRDLGASWDAVAKQWMVDAARLTLATDAVAAAAKDAKPFRFTSCKQCSARPNERGWPRIYKNGICSDCYREDNGPCYDW